jgi:XTP/dITP diphosphohydrolase
VTAFVLATANRDKAAEIRSILGRAGFIELLPRPETLGEVAETGSTLLDNARLKARAVAAATGMAAIADDTGLEVEALGGAPGVHSSRFAGEGASYADNVARLLAELEGKREARSRRARFRTVAVAMWPDGREVVAEGEAKGAIALVPRGRLGFGYDPLFIPDEGDGHTFADMDPGVKNVLSHRGRAFSALANLLAAEP